MNNRIAGVAAVACGVGAGVLWGGRVQTVAQSQSTATPSAAPALNLSANIGKICYLRYQDGSSSPSTENGTLKAVDDNWVVLDVLQIKGASGVTDASGRKYLQTVYTKTNRQTWISTKLIFEAQFDSDAIVR